MIFKPELAKLVRAGRKTQTRRLVIDLRAECLYKPGHCYGIQSGWGKRSNGCITVLEAPHQERLGEIDHSGARKEGFRTVAEFKDYWTGVHECWEPDHVVWVINFVLGDQTDRPRLLAARPGHEGQADGDYTSVPALALKGAGEEIGERRQSKYALAADSARKTGLADHRERLLSVVGVLRLEAAKLNAGSAVARKRLKSVEHQLRAYDREMRRSA